MSTRYYVEVDVDPVDVTEHLSLEKVLASHIDENLSCDLRADRDNPNTSWHGWMDVFTSRGTKGTHADIAETVHRLIPGAHAATRWICWEELTFDAEHDTQEDD